MTGDQFKAAIERLGMSQGAAADFLGVAIRTSHRYANGTTPIPEGFAKLLRLMIRLKLNPEEVR